MESNKTQVIFDVQQLLVSMQEKEMLYVSYESK